MTGVLTPEATMGVTGGLVGAWVFVVLSVRCASTMTTSGLPAGVSDIYFTNAEVGPGGQLYNAGTPRQIPPEMHSFDRTR